MVRKALRESHKTARNAIVALTSVTCDCVAWLRPICVHDSAKSDLVEVGRSRCVPVNLATTRCDACPNVTLGIRAWPTGPAGALPLFVIGLTLPDDNA